MSTSSLENNKVMYLDLTHKLNDYNEIYNMNTYVQNTNTQELDRLNTTNNTLKTRILRLKQEYLLTESGKRQWAFRTNLMMFTGIVTGLVVILLTMYSSDKLAVRPLVISCLVILVIYLLIVIYLVVANTERRNYAYDQYYWNPVNQQK